LAAAQDDIDRLGVQAPGSTAALKSVWERKKALLRQLEALTSGDS
jgi:hypothetical protein